LEGARLARNISMLEQDFLNKRTYFYRQLMSYYWLATPQALIADI
jgi:hypothetical protein